MNRAPGTAPNRPSQQRGHRAWHCSSPWDDCRECNISGVTSRLLCIACSALLILVFVPGCFRTFVDQSPGQLEFAVKNAARVMKDKEIERSSEALHAFLKGEMAFDRENYDEALKNFSTAAALVDSPSAMLHAKLAELYLRQGDLEKALEESTRALAESPDDRQVVLLHGGILEALNRTAEAEPFYLQTIEKAPKESEAYVLLSSLYLRLNNPKKSLEVLQRLSKQIPHDPLSYYYLGRTHEELANLRQAENYLRKALAMDPDRAQYGADLIRVLLKQKKSAQAKKLCEEMLRRDSENVLARRVLGQLYLGENKLELALEHLQVLEGVEKDPTITRFKIALILIEKQNFEEAARELTLVLAKSPENAEARYYLGTVYATLGRKKEALEELLKIKPSDRMFEKSRTLSALIYRQEGELKKAAAVVREALGHQAENVSLVEFLVLLLRDDKQYDQAREVLEAGLAKVPGDSRMLFSYAVVMSDLGDEQKSVEVMEQLLRKDPEHSEALNFVAYALITKRTELEKARSYIDRALKTDPKNGYYLDTLGWLQYVQGDYDSAAKTLEKAVAGVGDDLVILEHYGDALFRSGSVKKAVDVYRAAAENTREGKSKEDVEAKARVRQKLHELEQSRPDLFPMHLGK